MYADDVKSAVELADRYGQVHFPARPIHYRFTFSVEQRIRANPLGAIAFAAQVIADREAIHRYIESLPVPDEIRQEIRHILTLEYYHQGK